MSIKLNSPEKCEVIVITIDKKQHPIAWVNKKLSLIDSGLSEQEAEDDMVLHPTIEMEVHYDPELGCFLVESESIESTPIFNPYSGEEMVVDGENDGIESVIIEELEDGTFGIYNESGQCVESDFESYKDAEVWIDGVDDYDLVENFNL